MITQLYVGGSKIVKVEIKGKEVMIFDSNIIINGIRVEQILARDIKKLKQWRTRINKMTEKQIAAELRRDFRKNNGLLLSSEEVLDA